MWIRWSVVVAVTCLIGGCASYKGPPLGPGGASGSGPVGSYSHPPADPWMLTCIEPTASTPAWLSNGLHGIRLNRAGLWPLDDPGGSWSLAAYETSGEEKILTLRNPFALSATAGGAALEPTRGRDYRQNLDMRSGELRTEWTQSVAGGELKVAVRALAGPDALVHRLELTANRDVPIAFEFPVWGDVTPAPKGISAATSAEEWTIGWSLVGGSGDQWSVGQGRLKWSGTLATGQTVAFERLAIAGGQTPSSLMLAETTLEHMLQAPSPTPPVDLVIEGPVEDQQAVRSFLFYLRSAIPDRGEGPVSPMMLSSQTYNGHVFWDADVWVFPALALLQPKRASVIPSYRLKHAGAATENFLLKRSWAPGAAPASVEGVDALQYPWESSVSGLEVSPTETKQQHHITGSVVFGLAMAADLGLVDLHAVEAVGRKAAQFYRWRASKAEGMPNADAPVLWEIRDVISPDEFHRGDNDRYTNAVAEWTIARFGGTPAMRFVRPQGGPDGSGVPIPLNYAGDRGKGYKQTSGLLAAYPLQDPETEPLTRQMLELYADKVTENGPAMSDSVHALLWARAGDAEKGYAAWRRSWEGFTRHPLNLFSEKRKKEVTYFTTGAAGCLQTVLYGFLGFRIDSKPAPGSAWSAPLKNGRWLSVKPNLPRAWKRVQLENFEVLGKRYTLIATHDAVSVTTLGE